MSATLGGVFLPREPVGQTGIVYGLVADERVWREACVLLQQLRDVGSRVPAVLFNTSQLPSAALTAIHALGGMQRSLEPKMPIPASFVKPLRASHGGTPAWAKLALWAQTDYEKILYLDLDVVLLGNIDHMAEFPRDTFTPEVCSHPMVCLEDGAIASGINVGIMVIGPSRTRFTGLLDYMREVDASLTAVAHNESLSSTWGRRWLGSAEQSFIREYWDDILNASIGEPAPERRGWDWAYKTFTHPSACRRQGLRWRQRQATPSSPLLSPGIASPPGQCVPSPVSVMSRRYNARPLDCVRCPATLRPLIVHYACFRKPWNGPRGENWTASSSCRSTSRSNHSSKDGSLPAPSTICNNCIRQWTQPWFDAEDHMCDALEAATGPAAISAWKAIPTCVKRGLRGHSIASL